MELLSKNRNFGQNRNLVKNNFGQENQNVCILEKWQSWATIELFAKKRTVRKN